MKLAKGNMWDTPAHMYIITGNSTVRRDGSLVMGRGAAKEASIRFPGCNRRFGKMIIGHKGPEDYGFLWTDYAYANVKLGLFQVKYYWGHDADLELIAFSEEKLRTQILTHWRKLNISMNFPGIGNGRLDRALVLPIIERLPDNVTIWEL